MTCKEILLDYINNNEGWIKKVHLYSVAEDWDAATVDRDLRDMQTDGLIKGGYYKGKYRKVDLKQYCQIAYEEPKTNYKIELIDGIPTAVLN